MFTILPDSGEIMASKAKTSVVHDMSHESMARIAVQERGGCCKECIHKSALNAIPPQRAGVKVTIATFLVTVKCSLDPGRRTPFKGVQGTCPTRVRYERRDSLKLMEDNK